MRHRLRRPHVLVGLVGVATLLVGGCTTSGATSLARPLESARTSTVIHHSDFTAIRALLAARARAVTHDDERAFMATVSRESSAFYDAQRVVFRNLQALPLTSMSYEVGNSGLTNAAGVTGGPLLTPEVVEHVYFANTDRRPVGNEVDDTFVKMNGHWLLGADSTDTSDTGGDSARPWAGPRISVVTRGHLIVVTDASSPGAAPALATTVLSDLAFDARILRVPVDDHLMVDATSSGSVATFDNNESAGAVTFDVFASRDFRPTVFAGSRIKINPAQIAYLSQEPALLRHELTHYLMSEYSGLNPKWLTEGLAEYVSHQPAGLASEYMTPQTYSRLLARPRELTLSGLFGQDPSTDYPLAMGCVTYLVDHGGIAKVETLMKDYAAYDDAPYEDSHTNQVLEKVYGMTGNQVARGAFGLLEALRGR